MISIFEGNNILEIINRYQRSLGTDLKNLNHAEVPFNKVPKQFVKLLKSCIDLKPDVRPNAKRLEINLQNIIFTQQKQSEKKQKNLNPNQNTERNVRITKSIDYSSNQINATVSSPKQVQSSSSRIAGKSFKNMVNELYQKQKMQPLSNSDFVHKEKEDGNFICSVQYKLSNNSKRKKPMSIEYRKLSKTDKKEAEEQCAKKIYENLLKEFR